MYKRCSLFYEGGENLNVKSELYKNYEYHKPNFQTIINFKVYKSSKITFSHLNILMLFFYGNKTYEWSISHVLRSNNCAGNS
jgi:hypothetical protein